MRRRVVPRRDVEAENPVHAATVEFSQMHGPLEAVEVLLERLGDPDLADRRADGAELDPARGELIAELGMLGVREIQDVRAVDRAELDRLDAVPGQNIDLLDGVLGDLVGEGTDADHRSLRGAGSEGRAQGRSMITDRG